MAFYYATADLFIDLRDITGFSVERSPIIVSIYRRKEELVEDYPIVDESELHELKLAWIRYQIATKEDRECFIDRTRESYGYAPPQQKKKKTKKKYNNK